MTVKKQENPSGESRDKIKDSEIGNTLIFLKDATKSVQSEVEKNKGKQKLSRGPMVVEHIKDGLFSFESHGFKTEFLYLPKGKTDNAHAITNDKTNPLTNTFSFQLVSPEGITKKPLLAHGEKDIIVLANFINFTKKFILENKERLQTRQINGMNVGPFFEEEDGPGHKGVKYYSKDMFGKHTLLSGKNNFFDGGGNTSYNFNLLDYSDFKIADPIIRIHELNSIIPFLNHVYETQKKLQLSKLEIWRMTQANLSELKSDIEIRV